MHPNYTRVQRKRSRNTAQLSAIIADSTTPTKDSPAEKRRKNREMSDPEKRKSNKTTYQFFVGDKKLS